MYMTKEETESKPCLRYIQEPAKMRHSGSASVSLKNSIEWGKNFGLFRHTDTHAHSCIDTHAFLAPILPACPSLFIVVVRRCDSILFAFSFFSLSPLFKIIYLVFLPKVGIMFALYYFISGPNTHFNSTLLTQSKKTFSPIAVQLTSHCQKCIFISVAAKSV